MEHWVAWAPVLLWGPVYLALAELPAPWGPLLTVILGIVHGLLLTKSIVRLTIMLLRLVVRLVRASRSHGPHCLGPTEPPQPVPATRFPKLRRWWHNVRSLLLL